MAVAGHGLLEFVLALGIVWGRRFLSGRQFRVLLVICAVSMIGFAVYFGLLGLSSIY
ncbi:MAG: hypothetical protein V3S39_06505 [Thermodesulfobacteriota bacterium]